MMHLTPSLDKPEPKKLAEPGQEKPEGRGKTERALKGESETDSQDEDEEESEEEEDMSGNNKPGRTPQRSV